MKKLLNVVLVVVMVLAAAMSVQAQAELVVKDEGVERDIDPHTVDVAVGGRLLQLLVGKILGGGACRKPLFAQIDRVCARTDGGGDAVKAARRC